MNGVETFKDGGITQWLKKKYHKSHRFTTEMYEEKEKLARSLGIENLSQSQASEMTKGLNKQVQEFRSRSLAGRYPVIWTNALYEKVRVDGRVISMAVLVACGVNVQGQKPQCQRQIGFVGRRPRRYRCLVAALSPLVSSVGQ